MPSMTAQSCPQTLPCLTSTVILTKDIIEFIFPVRALRPRETEDLPESWGWKRQSQDPSSGPTPKFILLPLIPEYTWDSKGSNYKKSEFVTEFKKKNKKKHRHAPFIWPTELWWPQSIWTTTQWKSKCKSHWSGEKKNTMMSTFWTHDEQYSPEQWGESQSEEQGRKNNLPASERGCPSSRNRATDRKA